MHISLEKEKYIYLTANIFFNLSNLNISHRNWKKSADLNGNSKQEVNRREIAFLMAFETQALEAFSTTTRISNGNRTSENPAISADGRYVAFTSYANNLVSGDTNNTSDIFLYDRESSTTRRVSVDSNGIGGNDSSFSFSPSISANGRYVAFTSYASNLVSDDTNNTSDVFVHDTEIKITRRVSVGSNGIEGNRSCFAFSPSISADGHYVAFTSYASNLVRRDTNKTFDIFVHDTIANTTRRISVSSKGIQGNGGSYNPSISADGRYVAFMSNASNLVRGDTNRASDIFVYDTVLNTTRRLSVNSKGIQGNGDSSKASISADGRYVAFVSDANNLVKGDTNNAADIFVYDTVSNTIRRISVNDNGIEGNGDSNKPSISADGRYVGFLSSASNLVSGDTNNASDTFVYDTVTNTIRCVSVDANGIQGNSGSFSPSISADGRYVAFTSAASNLVSDDTNNRTDVFVYDSNSGTQNPWNGTSGDDTYTYTGTDNFTGYGLQGNDIITGSTGNDWLSGNRGNDSLLGGNGDDYLVGGLGNDTLLGGVGNDILDGSGYRQDVDILTGGDGADTFVLGNQSIYYRGTGYAMLTDFDHIQGDKIQVLGDISQYQLRQENLVGTSASDTSIYYVGDGGKNLIGVVQDSLNVSLLLDFVFV